ncbi:MAG: cation:dicarboxylase symporter family transporter [Xenococcaceae cyanobacterium]
MTSKTGRKIRLSLSTQTLLGLLLGLLAGLFFGEMVAWLEIVGRAFILLLQMTVLPFVILSLISGLGSLTYQDAKNFALKGGIILVLSWMIILVIVGVMPLAFPNWESSSFFSTTLIEGRPAFDFLKLYIPANPFYSMANNIVPAVVLFSIGTGVVLIGIENKQELIASLSTLTKAMTQLTNAVAKLTPIGVFAITASAAGTMKVDEFGRLQVFLVTYIAIALLITFWILPILVTSLTPLKYQDVVWLTKNPLITAFATGSSFIVLPLLAEKSKQLLQLCRMRAAEADSAVDVLVPASFNFPNMGKLITMSFVPFAAWFIGSSLSITQYPNFLVSGLFTFFSDVNVAIPFLLDVLQLPTDLFQLFVIVNNFTGRFGALLSAMHTLVLAVLGGLAIAGLLTFRPNQLVRYAVLSVLLTAVTLGSIRAFFTYGVENTYTKNRVLTNLELLRVRQPIPAKVFHSLPLPLTLSEEAQPERLAQIRARGFLRACYHPEDYPFAYFNAKRELVGFDVEMAHILARELGVRLEFAPLSFEDDSTDKFAEHLNENYCDILMAGTVITPKGAEVVSFSNPFLDKTLAFLIKDYRRDEFASWKAIQGLESLRIGITADVPYYKAKLLGLAPKAEIVRLNSIKQFLESGDENLDALVIPAEEGSAWSILYPNYTVAIPQPVVAVPVAYAMARGDQQLLDVVNAWLELKQKDGTIKSLYDYWVQGKTEAVQPPRWSVIRNVLHWVD